MDFIINTNELQEAITKCNTVIINKQTSLLLKGIHICVKDNKVEFRATNSGENWVIYNCDCEASEDIEFTLQNTKEIVKAIKYFEAEYKGYRTKTTFEIVNNNCTISCIDKKIKIKVFDDSEIKFPMPQELNKKDMNEYSCNAVELLELVEKVRYAVAKNNMRPVLKGVCFDKNDIVALDEFRLAKITQNIISVKRQFVLEASIFDIIKKVFGKNDNITIREDSKNVLINCGNNTIICEKFKGEFFKYERIITPEKAVVHMTIDVKNTIQQLKYLYEFTDKVCLLEMNGNKLRTQTYDTTVEAVIKADIVGEDKLFTIGINCRYMLEALQNIGSDKAIIKLVTAVDPFYIESVGQKYNSLASLCPIRVTRSK